MCMNTWDNNRYAASKYVHYSGAEILQVFLVCLFVCLSVQCAQVINHWSCESDGSGMSLRSICIREGNTSLDTSTSLMLSFTWDYAM